MFKINFKPFKAILDHVFFGKKLGGGAGPMVENSTLFFFFF